jgi:predicted lipid-binding transport protein (Tim44 family)
MRWRVFHRVLSGLLILALLACATAALARPGSGHSFSGGSRSGGGGGGGDGVGLLLQLVIWLVFRHPTVGIPLLLLLVVAFLLKQRWQDSQRDWSTRQLGPTTVAVQPYASAPTSRSALSAIQTLDPEFSVVLFEDFVYLLYAELQRARAQVVAALQPFVAPGVLERLRAGAELSEVRGIVIGAMHIVQFSGLSAAALRVGLEFESNYVEVTRSGSEQRYYAVDRVTLSRSRSAKSRPYARARKLDCPNCGAPLEAVQGTVCSYCQEDVGHGRFDWNVDGLQTLTKERRRALLTKDVREEGTELPTLIDPGATGRLARLQAKDRWFSWQGFEQRVGHIFAALQPAWSERDPAQIRAFVSDNLFQSLVYWIELYRQERCRNITEQTRILRVELANVLSDLHYDAVTVRLFATGLDYTVSDDGKLLSGSRRRERKYSEYWTLIRGSSRTGPSRSDNACPNCGAPLAISMAGNCEYCSVKITSGEFDWVLSRIEQDEVYSG